MNGQKRENLLVSIFLAMAVFMFFPLLYYSFSMTGIHKAETWDQYIYFRQDLLVVNILLLLLAVLVFVGFGKLYDRYIKKLNSNVLLAIVCLVSFAFSLFWVLSVNAEPIGDQLLVTQYATAFNMGDFHGFDKGQYFSVSSWQLGMISFLRVIYKIFGDGNWRVFHFVNAGMIPVIVLSGAMILRLITNKNRKLEWYYCILALFCFPMYPYTVFVYGELVSTALALVGAWLFLSCLKNFMWWKAVVLGVVMGIAVEFRRNVLILVIAMGLSVIVKLIGRFYWKNLMCGICLVAGILVIHYSHWGLYAKHVDPEAHSIPSILYIVMGLNDDYGHAGWYNAYNYHVFDEADYSVNVAKTIAMEHLDTYRHILKTNPSYYVDFYKRKMNSQWLAPMYQCLKMTNSYDAGKVSPLIADIYNGQGVGKVINFGMKVYQLLLYASVFGWILGTFRKKKNVEPYVVLIAVFGGFLFSLMWEAKPRYVFPYLLMLLPYGAMGVSMLTEWLMRLFKFVWERRKLGDAQEESVQQD